MSQETQALLNRDWRAVKVTRRLLGLGETEVKAWEDAYRTVRK